MVFRNPNNGPHDVEVIWPQYYDSDTDDRQLMRFTEVPAVELEKEEDREMYDFWNGEFMDIARPDGLNTEDEVAEWNDEGEQSLFCMLVYSC